MTNRSKRSDDHAAFARKLVDLANRNEETMDGALEPFRHILAEGDVVFAIWQDPEEEYGVTLEQAWVVSSCTVSTACVAIRSPRATASGPEQPKEDVNLSSDKQSAPIGSPAHARLSSSPPTWFSMLAPFLQLHAEGYGRRPEFCRYKSPLELVTLRMTRKACLLMDPNR
jgi:hypothetical protein